MRSIALPVLLLAGTASGAEVRSEVPGTAVPGGEVIPDDLYATGERVVVEGQVQGDLVAAGGEVDVRGGVTGDVIVAGGTVRIQGPVGGSIRAAGGEIDVAGTVAEDLVAGGGRIVVTGRVGRDVLAGGGELALRGGVGRNVGAATGTLTIAGSVGGDVRAQAGRVQLEDGARIAGALSYAADEAAQIAPGASVGGGIIRTERPEHGARGAGFRVVAWLRRVVGFTVLGLLLLLVAPGLARASEGRLRDSPGLSLVIGLAFLVAFPLAAIFVFGLGLLLGGFWIGIFALVLWALVLALGVTVTGSRLGALLTARPGRELARGLVLLLGVGILVALPLLPWIGGVLLALAALPGAGALVLAVAATARPAVPSPAPGAAP